MMNGGRKKWICVQMNLQIGSLSSGLGRIRSGKRPGGALMEESGRKKKKYSDMFLKIIAALLDTDHARNSHQLLGSRPSRDIFYSGEEPISRGRRFLPIPGYDQYVVNMNFNGRTMLRLCGDMSKRCNTKVEIEIHEKQYEDQEGWNRVDL